MGIPEVVKTSRDIFSQLQYQPDQIMVGVKTKIDTSSGGSILFLLSMDFVQNTVETMLGQPVEREKILEDEDCLSAVEEIINYMTAGYSKVIGAYLNAPIFISTASIGIEPVKNILEETLQELPKEKQQVAYVNTTFSAVDEDGNKTKENGQVLIFPENSSIEGLIRIMKD